jgi:hypothetical protein
MTNTEKELYQQAWNSNGVRVERIAAAAAAILMKLYECNAHVGNYKHNKTLQHLIVWCI